MQYPDASNEECYIQVGAEGFGSYFEAVFIFRCERGTKYHSDLCRPMSENVSLGIVT
jgi:hypothetical protein